MLSKDQFLTTLTRRTKTIASEVFGGDVRIRELSRAEWRQASKESEMPERGADGQTLIHVDQWNSRVFAAGVIGENDAPLFAPEDVLAFPNRDDVWSEIQRIGGAILDLSEVGSDALKAPSSS